jgi:hypothetical protein
MKKTHSGMAAADLHPSAQQKNAMQKQISLPGERSK